MTKEEILARASVIREESKLKSLPVMREGTAALLASLTSARMPAQALEIGTCAGVSGLTALAAGAQKLTTVEIDSDLAETARKNFAECGLSGRVTVINDDCRVALRYLEGNVYDMVVLDGPKSDLDFQYETCLGMLSDGGLIFIDDIAYHGMIKAEGAPHKQRTIINAMRTFLRKLENDERVTVKFYDIEDGVAVAEKKYDE